MGVAAKREAQGQWITRKTVALLLTAIPPKSKQHIQPNNKQVNTRVSSTVQRLVNCGGMVADFVGVIIECLKYRR